MSEIPNSSFAINLHNWTTSKNCLKCRQWHSIRTIKILTSTSKNHQDNECLSVSMKLVNNLRCLRDVRIISCSWKQKWSGPFSTCKSQIYGWVQWPRLWKAYFRERLFMAMKVTFSWTVSVSFSSLFPPSFISGSSCLTCDRMKTFWMRQCEIDCTYF